MMRQIGVLGLKVLLSAIWLTAGAFNLMAQEGGCTDNPTNEIWCGGEATIIDVVTISPYTNALPGSIVCVGETVTLNLSQTILPSTNFSQTLHTCPSNYYGPVSTNNGASPSDIIDYFYYETPENPNGYVDGYGNSAAITISDTNGFYGWGYIWGYSAEMTTNAPGCGYAFEDDTTEGTYYAFVAVTGISSGGEYVTNSSGTGAYLAEYCPGGYVTVAKLRLFTMSI